MSVTTQGAANGQKAAPKAAVPFLAGSFEYAEPIQTYAITPGASQQDFSLNITPGGFLRGVSLFVTASGGALGGGALTGDTPWNLLSNVSIESIDGTPILYPKNGYQEYLSGRFFRPWDGDPAADPDFSNSVNPAFNLRVFNESRMTLGCLPNTDARAQYRFKFSVAPLATFITGGAPTAPVLTIAVFLETYAQPPSSDYAGNPIAQLPDGLLVQRFTSREIQNLSGGTNTIKLNRVGNLIRNEILVVRNSSGVRIDLTADPIRERIDNTTLLNEYRQRRQYENNRFFGFAGYSQGFGASGSKRPTGVYVYPRQHNVGDMDGMYWLPTTEATYLMYELNGAPAGGSLEIITEDLAPTGPVPAYLQGI